MKELHNEPHRVVRNTVTQAEKEAPNQYIKNAVTCRGMHDHGLNPQRNIPLSDTPGPTGENMEENFGVGKATIQPRRGEVGIMPNKSKYNP